MTRGAADGRASAKPRIAAVALSALSVRLGGLAVAAASGQRAAVAAALGCDAVGERQQYARDHEHHVDHDEQNSSRSLACLIAMNCLSSWIAEIATIDESTFSFSDIKSMVPIHVGQSLWPEWSILETKFS